MQRADIECQQKKTDDWQCQGRQHIWESPLCQKGAARVQAVRQSPGRLPSGNRPSVGRGRSKMSILSDKVSSGDSIETKVKNA